MGILSDYIVSATSKVLDYVDRSKTDWVNVNSLGLNGDDTSVNNAELLNLNSIEKKNLYFPDGVYSLYPTTMRELIKNKDSLSGNGKIKFKYFKTEPNVTDTQFNGEIPISKLDDEIFMSMNKPYDGLEYITSRTNGSVSNYLKEDIVYTDAIGAIYRNYTDDGGDYTLPDTFTLVLGKIKQFAYISSLGKWITLTEEEHPIDAKLYTLPWTSTSVTNLTHTFNEKNQMEISLTANDLQDACVHFWSKKFYFGEETWGNILASDVLFTMTCMEVYIKDVNEDITNKFIIETGIDSKYKASEDSTYQLFYGSPTALSTKLQRYWGHTVYNTVYDEYVNVSDIMNLWNMNTERDYFGNFHKTLYIPQNAAGATASSLKLFEIPISGTNNRENQIMLTAKNMGAYGTKMGYLQVLLHFREVNNTWESPTFLEISHANGKDIDMNGKFSIALNSDTGNYEIYVNGLAGTISNRLVVDIDMMHVYGSRIILNKELIENENYHYADPTSYSTSKYSFVTLSEQTNLTVKRTSTITVYAKKTELETLADKVVALETQIASLTATE